MQLPEHPLEAFAVDATGGAGISRARARGPAFTMPTRGLRFTGSGPDSESGRCRALQLVLPPTGAFGGLTAARLWGLPLPQSLQDPTAPADFRTPPGVARVRRTGVVGTRSELPSSHLVELAGVTVTSPVRTWIDLAPQLSPEFLVAIGDHILARGLGTIDDFTAVLHWGFRRRGIGRARKLVELLNPRAESPPESRVRYWLIASGLPEPAVNADLVLKGEWLARPDLMYREARLAIEYDGIVHLPDEARQYDAKRRNLLQRNDWEVITLTRASLLHPFELVTGVRSRYFRRLVR